MKFLNKLKAFTLAEVIITLVVIGIIAAVVIPVAIQSKPDENIMKFKKAHNTLYQTIKTLINSDKFYKDGDLGIKADGTRAGYTEADATYFCKTVADILSTKKVDCATYESDRHGEYGQWLASDEYVKNIIDGTKMTRTVIPATIQNTKERFDIDCKKSGKTMGAEIITTDGVAYYQSNKVQFGSIQSNLRYFSPPDQFPANYADENGMDIAYKIYCIDVDGIPDDVTEADCKNECPFGYGIREDGKILPGARADEWLKKDFHGEE